MNKRSGSTCQSLQADDGTPFLMVCARIVPIHFGGRRYSARLIQADVKRPLMEADFRRQHNLLVDICGQRLIEAEMYSSVSCGITAAPVNKLALIDKSSKQFPKVLAEHMDLLRSTFIEASVHHGVQHFVTTTGPPFYAKTRQFSPDKLTIVKHEFDEMEQMGIIHKSNSPWASPLHVVPTPGGGWRPVEISVIVITSQRRIDTRCLIFKISSLSWLVKLFSPR